MKKESYLDINKLHEDLIKYAKEGDLINIIILNKLGVNIHFNKESALMESISYGQIKIIDYLIGKGSNLNIENSKGLTVAVKNNQEKVVNYLLKKGIDMYAEDANAFKLALDNHNYEIVKCFIDNNFKIDNYLDVFNEQHKNNYNSYVDSKSIKKLKF